MASGDSTDGFDDTTMEMLSANLPSNAFTTNTPDPRLERARQEMERTNQITPLLKEELRLRILSKRLEKGEPEIEINSAELKHYELTEEEQAKRERRKAQNRRAAKKCREKRKMKTLSDAEKFRIIKEENQQLRDRVTYLRHNEAIYRTFCTEHILKSQCSFLRCDESSRCKLLALLHSNIVFENHAPYSTDVTPTSSSSGSMLGTNLQQSHMEPTTSSSIGLQSKQNPATFATIPISLPSTAAQAVLQAEQSVTTIEELKDIPVHEISSLLPTEPDFSGSDHSLESTPPVMSPTSLFNAMSPISTGLMSSSGANSTYFNQLTPSTSYSGNNTSSFSSSNDDIFAASPSDCKNQLTSFLDPNVSTSNIHLDTSVGYLHGGINSNDQILRKVCPRGSRGELSSTPKFPTHDRVLCVHNKQGDPSSSVVSGSANVADGHSVFSVAVTNNFTVNTAFIADFPTNLDYFLSSYLNVGQLHSTGLNLSNCNGDSVNQTVPISPLTPLSPPSPNVTVSPMSPSPLSTEMNHMECNVLRVQSCTAGVPSSHNSATHKTSTPARPVVRRTSSTTSVPSPYFNHHASIALSPPPSVPSPTSNGVPESPSILALSSACDENAYMPHFSPVSVDTSTDHSPVRLFDVSEDEYNYSLC